MKPPEEPLPDPSDATLKRATDAFRVGDFKRARAALDAVARGDLPAEDQPVYDRLARGLRMDPLFVYGLIACALLWALLFWRNTGIG